MDNNDIPKMESSSAPISSEKPAAEGMSESTAQNGLLAANIGLSTYKFARKAHKIGSHIHRVAGAFDPSLGDADDVSDDSASSMSDSDSDSDDSHDDDDDNSDDDVHSEHSDDESIHSDDEAQNSESHSGSHQSAFTPNVASIGKGLKKLPPTRSAKPRELFATSTVTSVPATTTTTTSTTLARELSSRDSSAMASTAFAHELSLKGASITTSTPVTHEMTSQGTSLTISTPVTHEISSQGTSVTTSTPITREMISQEGTTKVKSLVTVRSFSSSSVSGTTLQGARSISTPKSSDAATPPPSSDKASPPAEPTFKIVKVRKPDGTIVKVKRPIKAGTEITEKTTKQKTEISSAEISSAAATLESKPEIKKTQTTRGIISTDNEIKTQKTRGISSTDKEIKSGITVSETEKVSDAEKSGDSTQKPRKETKAEILHRRTSKATQIVIWSIMIAFPLFFIVLAIITASISGKSENNAVGLGILKTNKIAVSLWPIVYAAVAAQALRMYASYKVETGLRLITLEQLISSHSVASAIKQPFLLQRINWTSIALLCLWSLSPLAGQAILRMSYLGPSGQVVGSTLRYLSTSVQSGAFATSTSERLYQTTVDTLLSHSLISSIEVQEEPMDSWGNIKIPSIEAFENAGKNGTIAVGDSPVYSSLLGIPITGLLEDSNKSTFALNSRYLAFDCPAMIEQDYEQINATAATLSSTAVSSMTLYVNSAWSMIMGILPLELGQAGKLIFASMRPGTGDNNDSMNMTYGYTLCDWNWTYVTSNVSCNATDCHVDHITRTNGSEIDNMWLFTTWNNFIENFVSSGSGVLNGTESAIQYYINDTTSYGSGDLSVIPDLYLVPTSDMNAHLSTLLNTYWLGGLVPSAITKPLKSNDSYDEGTILTADVRNTSTERVYVISWGWLTLLLAASVLLLLGGIVGALCDSRTVGPDIFGFASSLAHRNKYMRVPTGDSTMGGPKRTRMLGHVTVMLQDVKPHQDVGKIALGTVENGGAKLQHGRLYK